MRSEGRSWIGANFWSRSGGPRMWSRYDPALVREELRVLAGHGLSVTRSFFYWPDAVPEVERLDEAVMRRFTDFLDAHLEAGMRTIPTFLVGHMSGDNWDPAWRHGEDLYRDTWMVAQECWFICEMTRRFDRHDAVVAWLVSNEMPLYGSEAGVEEVTAWARLVVQAVRAGGSAKPVSIGDGAWGIEVSGRDNGYSLRRLSGLVDFFGPHVYPMEDDQVRQLMSAAFACGLSGSFGRPVILEEFGASSDLASDENIAHYYRHVLHSSLLAGAGGWIAWNNCDFDELGPEDPYRHHLFELHFGLTDRAGRPKPQLREMKVFAGLVADLDDGGYEPDVGDVAIVVPEHMDTALRVPDPSYRTDARDDLFQSYIAAREADLPVSFVREREGIPGSARLYLAPCLKLATGGGYTRLGELVRGGATVYASYFAGSVPGQRGPWIPWLEELFGVRHHLRYGLADPIDGDEVNVRFIEPLGELVVGTVLRFAVSGSPTGRARLPVEPSGAHVLAVDGDGRPALLRHFLGEGSSVFCTLPLEHMAARTAEVNPECTWRLYSGLATAAGVRRPVRVDDGRVMVGTLRHGEAGHVSVVANCSAEPVAANLLPGAGFDLAGVTVRGGGDVAGDSIDLAPFGVAVLSW